MLVFDKKREGFQIVGLKQFDTSEPLVAQFLDDGKPIDLSKYGVRLEATKPDGKIVIDDASIKVQNTCEIVMQFNEQLTVVNGTIKAQFVLVNLETKLQDSTFTFLVDVQGSVLNISSDSKSVVTLIESLNKQNNTATVNIGNLKTQNAEAKTNIDTLTKTNATAVQTNATLTKTNETATATNKTLNDTITKANQTNTTLNDTNTKATTTNATLTKTNQTATTTDTTLNATITKATQTNTTLTETNKALTTTNATATKTNADLTNTNKIATQTKTDLDTLNKEATTTKANLDTSNTTAQETKKQLDESIKNAENSVAEVILEEFKTGTIPTDEAKVRLKKVDGTYVIPLGRANAIFMSDGKTTLETKINGKVDKNSEGGVSISGGLTVTKSITTKDDLIAEDTIFAQRIKGKEISGNKNTGNDKIYIGSGNCRLDTTGGKFRIFTTKSGNSKDNGITIDTNGVVQMKIDGVSRHEFFGSGKKTGGTMEIEGTVYGMSPTDSPQTLIEYVEYDIDIQGDKIIKLDEVYSKMVSKYAVFPSNPKIEVVKKEVNQFTVKGTGITDFVIKGQRRDAEDYYRIMGGFTHGSTEADSE